MAVPVSMLHEILQVITVVGCWAHLRRKFFDALKTLPKDKQPGSNASKGVAYCDKLFRLEKQFALLTPEIRYKERERLSKPLLNEFYDWIEQLNALPNSLLGKAIHYAKSQKKYLERYLLDGRLEISNNRAEREHTEGCKGQRNLLQLNCDRKRNGLNPFEYLAWIFTNAPNLGKPGYVTKFEDFLPSSAALPEKIFTPKPNDVKPIKCAWEED